MSAQPVEAPAHTSPPDFEMQALLLKTLQQHPRPIFQTDGFKVQCAGRDCDWAVPVDNSKRNRSNRHRFLKHQTHKIETAITAWLDEGEAA